MIYIACVACGSLATVLGFGLAAWLLLPKQERSPKIIANDFEIDARLETQMENLLNYNGTERGQVKIED